VSGPFTQPINASTRYCAVYGHPVKHSASPAMQNAGIAALGLNWRYLAFEVHPDDLWAAIEGAKAMRFIGINLTVPHKVPAMSLVNLADKDARLCGAVNTIRFEGLDEQGQWWPLHRFDTGGSGWPDGQRRRGLQTSFLSPALTPLSKNPSPLTPRPSVGEAGLRKENRSRRVVGKTGAVERLADAPREVLSHGFNTDADAIPRALREDLGLNLAGARVLLLGAGGAGRTAALKLAGEKVSELFLMNRTRSKAEAVAKEIGDRHPDVKVTIGYPAQPVELILNATSLGLKADDPLPLDEKQFSLGRAGAVYDMVYRPAETWLLKAAKAAGCRTANGLGMLLYQGASALELWSGQAAPVEVMRRALESNVYGETQS